MRFALLADIHGNLPALEAVMNDLEAESPDAILVAGDWIAGPDGDECCQLLKEHAATSVLGNTDTRLLEFIDGKTPPKWKSLKQFAMARWDAAHLGADAEAILRSMPAQRVLQPDGAHSIRIVHGSPDDPSEGLFDDRKTGRIESIFSSLQETILVCGHTHRPMTIQRDGKWIVNPGSVSVPLNGQVGAQYALLDWLAGRWQVSHRLVDYDRALVIGAFEQSGFLAECSPLARAFLESILTGDDIAHEFFLLIERLAKEHQVELNDHVPDDLWTEASMRFEWQNVMQRRKGNKS